jgi:hypothetical protein
LTFLTYENTLAISYDSTDFRKENNLGLEAGA